MQDYDNYDFDQLILENFKKSKQASLYDKVHYLHFDKHKKIQLLELKKAIGTNRACVLLSMAEPHYFDPGSMISRQWLEFKDALLKYQIFNCDFFVTCLFFDSSHDASIAYLNKNFYDWKFHKFDQSMMYVRHIPKAYKLENNINELFLSECRYKLSHVNFTHRMHRQLFSKFLIREDLVKNNLIAINPGRMDVVKDKNAFFQSDGNKIIKCIVRDDWFYNKQLLDLWRDVPLVYHKHADITNKFDVLKLDFLNKSSFNIISETVFDYPFPNFGEKTIQSLLSKRPFIMIGPCGNLQHLRNRGYKTFNCIIDESYDDIQDPNARLEAVMRLVLELNKKSLKELKDTVYEIKDILIHNYSLMLENIRNFTNVIK